MANRFAGLVSWRENLAAERDRWPLWLPVALGIGAGGYFALPVEPSLAVAWIALGLAKLRESRVETPVLDHAVITHLTARIVSLEPRQRGVRLVLDEVRSGTLQPAPRRVRVASRTDTSFRPGDWLSPVLGSKYT